MSFLVVEGLCKRYGAVEALTDVSLRVAPRSRTAIVGPSGSGKTTLLRLLAGFEPPDTGRILLDGAVLADGAAAVPAHRRAIGIVSQDGSLFPHLSVAENVGFGLPRRDAGRAARIEELLHMVGLDAPMGARRPDQLSGGQQQRVALARALARRPRLMLLDEPFSALDTALRAGTRATVASVLEAAGVPALLVTHDQAEALSFADQVAVMRAGRLVQAGPPRDLYDHPADPETACFLGEALILPARLHQGWAECALGRVRVADRVRQGTATLMLRPEQLVLRPASLAAACREDEGCRGEVVGVEFAGGGACYAIRPRGHGGEVLRVRNAGPERFGPGDTVAITVGGTAHLFDGG